MLHGCPDRKDIEGDMVKKWENVLIFLEVERHNYEQKGREINLP